jgi:hypothetical protein
MLAAAAGTTRGRRTQGDYHECQIGSHDYPTHSSVAKYLTRQTACSGTVIRTPIVRRSRRTTQGVRPDRFSNCSQGFRRDARGIIALLTRPTGPCWAAVTAAPAARNNSRGFVGR